jgi:hypothetical protein
MLTYWGVNSSSFLGKVDRFVIAHYFSQFNSTIYFTKKGKIVYTNEKWARLPGW